MVSTSTRKSFKLRSRICGKLATPFSGPATDVVELACVKALVLFYDGTAKSQRSHEALAKEIGPPATPLRWAQTCCSKGQELHQFSHTSRVKMSLTIRIEMTWKVVSSGVRGHGRAATRERLVKGRGEATVQQTPNKDESGEDYLDPRRLGMTSSRNDRGEVVHASSNRSKGTGIKRRASCTSNAKDVDMVSQQVTKSVVHGRSLYKYYAERRWAEAFVNGELLFRSLAYYRDHEQTDTRRGRRDEGRERYSRPAGSFSRDNMAGTRFALSSDQIERMPSRSRRRRKKKRILKEIASCSAMSSRFLRARCVAEARSSS